MTTKYVSFGVDLAGKAGQRLRIGADEKNFGLEEDVYIAGFEDIDDSKRIALDPDTDIPRIEKRVDGIWQPGSFEIAAGTLWVGKDAALSGVGHRLATESADGSIMHLHVQSEFDGEISTRDAHLAHIYNFVERMVLQSDDSNSWTGSSWESTSYSPYSTLSKKIYFKTGSVAATQPVRFRMYRGTDDTGILIFDQTYPASLFPADSEIELDLKGYLEFKNGTTYFNKISSSADLSLKVKADSSGIWLAVDMSFVREDNLLQTKPWTDGDNWNEGDYFIDSRKIYICNTTGVQTGTFASNSDKWGEFGDAHESTYDHSNYDTAYSWGDHAGLYDPLGSATSAVATHESNCNHSNYLVNNADDETTGTLTAANLISNNDLGVGIASPERMCHVQGRNATFRIDRDANSPAVMMHRFPSGDFTTPLKGFMFGVKAYGEDDGEFFIIDYHQNVTGGGDARFLINNTGQIGINASTPDTQLHVKSVGNIAKFESTSSIASITLKETESEAYLISESNILSLGFDSSVSANNVNIDSSGYLGIGVTDPDYPLHVACGDGIAASIFRGTQNSVDFYFDGIYTDIRFGGQKVQNRIGTWITQPFKIVTDSTNRMTILADGKVGIGKDTPGYKLHVAGNTLIEGSDGFDSIGDNAYLYIGDENSFLKAKYGDVCNLRGHNGLKISESAGHIATFANGKVGIGTESPDYALHVAQQDGDSVLTLERIDDIIGIGYGIGAIVFKAGESTPYDVGMIRVIATESWTDTSSPTRMQFRTNPVGSVGATNLMTMEENGFLTVDGIDTEEIGNPNDILKIQPNANADVELFGDVDVDNAENGKVFYVKRQAAEGNKYIRMYIGSSNVGYIHASCPLTLQAQQPFTINSVTDDIIFKVGDNAGSKGFYFKDSDGTVLADMDSNGKMHFTGDVGIGISPIYDLHIERDFDGVMTSRLYNSNSNGITEHVVGASGGGVINLIANSGPGSHFDIPSGTAGVAVSWGGNFVFAVGSSGSATEKMRLTENGLVIGHTTGSLPLEVYSDDDNQIACRDSTAQAAGVGGGILFGGKYTDAGLEALGGRIEVSKCNSTSGNYDFDMIFEVQNVTDTLTERLRLTSDGRVGIGTDTPEEKLDVKSTGDYQVQLSDSTAYAQGVGGSILFSGRINSGTNDFPGGSIKAEKWNAGSGELGFDLVFTSHPNVIGALVEMLRLSAEDGNAVIAGLKLSMDQYYNTYIGCAIPSSATSDSGANIVLGDLSLQNLTEGQSNIVLGISSGAGITDGYSNIVIGSGSGNDYAGSSSNIDTNNILIGYNIETVNGKDFNTLNIGNLLFGDTGAGHLRIGGGTGTALLPSAALEINSTSGALIVPKMTTTQRNALTAANGMIIYDTTQNAFRVREAGAWRSI